MNDGFPLPGLMTPAGNALSTRTLTIFKDHHPLLVVQCEASKIAKLVYNSNNYDLWYANNYSYWGL